MFLFCRKRFVFLYLAFYKKHHLTANESVLKVKNNNYSEHFFNVFKTLKVS